MKNRGCTPILINLVGIHPRQIRLREEVEKVKKVSTTTSATTDTGWSLESKYLIDCD